MKIEVDPKYIWTKKVGKAGSSGVIYVPKKFIGKTMTVFLEEKE